MTTLITLTWHHFLRSLWGGAADTATTEGFARRLAELGAELGAGDMAVHGLSLLAITARLSGRFGEAAEHVEALRRLGGIVDTANPWLGWAAGFAVAVGGGAAGATPPRPPEASPDPVVAMSELVIEAELTLAGRVEEALERAESAVHLEIGPIGELTGLLSGLTRVLVGQAADALVCVELAAQAARALDAPPTAAAAAALLAEITGSPDGLPPAPERAGSVSEALVLRAHAVLGDARAGRALRRAAEDLALPGLLRGL